MLTEIRRRHKVGGILDRRFGENDPTLTPEQKAAERFARENERRSRKSAMFNLEDDGDDVQLTHLGQSISFNEGNETDDFAEHDLDALGSEDDDGRPRKKRRVSDDALKNNDMSEEAGLLPERQKSKQEVMTEVIAKSKIHKYERQQAKEDDDDLRRRLDQELPEFLNTMRNHKSLDLQTQPPEESPVSRSDQAGLLVRKGQRDMEEEYNERVRQMALDKRSKPSNRIKTDEERAREEAERLKELERLRLQRMRGDSESSIDEDEILQPREENEEQDDAQAFGLQQNTQPPRKPTLDVEDEDNFVIDTNLVASDSEAELSVSDLSAEASNVEVLNDDDDDNFLNGLSLPGDDAITKRVHQSSDANGEFDHSLAYTFLCPQNLGEILQITGKTPWDDIPVIVQRIRALYHPQLDSSNTQKLQRFTSVLVEFIAYLTEQKPHVSFRVLETLIRHIHSLSKNYPETAGAAFRAHLKQISRDRPLNLKPCDLIMLTAISIIFPTSDHFHSVVTPSVITIARYLGQSSVQSLQDVAIGAYCCSLALNYQTLSRRYMPEVINYLLNTLLLLAPKVMDTASSKMPYRPAAVDLSIQSHAKPRSSPLPFWEMMEANNEEDSAKADLFQNILVLLKIAVDLWKNKSAFPEIIDPALGVLSYLQSQPNASALSPALNDQVNATNNHISILLHDAFSSRQPLHLHNHRPIPVKTSFPKFDAAFNPTRHADPDRERANMNKLRAEHRRERKGAMRELRKDANFIARESLREKKERDEAYERKFKKLREEIQTEEGREKNEYERERRRRKGRF